MCGRFTLITSLSDLAKRFQFNASLIEWDPRYNIAPKQPVLTLLPDRTPKLMTWGIQPKWSKKLLINARLETASEKPTFKRAYADRRCIILADSFYEWKGSAPWRILRKDKAPFAIGGIYEPEGAILLTMPANPAVAPIHSRMPLILTPDAEELWLSGKSIDLPTEEEALTSYRVSDYVNSWKHEGTDCILPAF